MKRGDRVKHPGLGTGTVIEIEATQGQENDPWVTIQHDSHPSNKIYGTLTNLIAIGWQIEQEVANSAELKSEFKNKNLAL